MPIFFIPESQLTVCYSHSVTTTSM